MTPYKVRSMPAATIRDGKRLVVDLYDPDAGAIGCVDPSLDTRPLPEDFRPLITYSAAEYVPDTDPGAWELGEPVIR